MATTKNRFLLFCEPCSFKKVIIDEIAKNYEGLPRAAVPGGYPAWDEESKSIKARKTIQQPTMANCPKCGRGVILKRLPDTYTRARDEQARFHQEEKDKQKKWEQEQRDQEIQ